MSQKKIGRRKQERGISLVEVIIIMVGIAILAAAVMQSMTHSLKQSRERETEREMRMLQIAIAGDPSQMSVAGGARSDFGYVGDVGAFPPDLGALVENPGGYSTWDGPYLPPGFANDGNDFKTDAWGKTYTYNGVLEIVSHGSGSTIRRGSNSRTSDYLDNTLIGEVRDAADSLPGSAWMDSARIEIVVPDGLGSLQTKVYQPDSSGEFTIDSLPVGKHLMRAIFLPELDTLIRYSQIIPRNKTDDVLRFNFAQNYFSADLGGDSMLTLVEGSHSVFGSGTDCNNISFEIRNNTGEDVEVTSIELTWPSPTAYYQEVWWAGARVWNNSTPRNGSGDTAVFDNPQTIIYGWTVPVEVKLFRSTPTGNGSKPDMSGTTFTVLFSDGSTFDVTMGECN
ncbi:MAG: hypothetical protein JSV52_07185 [Candidatus Zixiibacteriota bacterium]|nr:MAG: hypothetical protein JSV52_07185 [candidate division Zixibacteria bacterium]